MRGHRQVQDVGENSEQDRHVYQGTGGVRVGSRPSADHREGDGALSGQFSGRGIRHASFTREYENRL